MAANMNQFMTDEYVLAYHGPLLYEARVSGLVSILDPLGSFCVCFGSRARRMRNVRAGYAGRPPPAQGEGISGHRKVEL